MGMDTGMGNEKEPAVKQAWPHYDKRYTNEDRPPREGDDVQWSLRMPVAVDSRINELSGQWFEHRRLANTLRRVIAIGLTAIDEHEHERGQRATDEKREKDAEPQHEWMRNGLGYSSYKPFSDPAEAALAEQLRMKELAKQEAAKLEDQIREWQESGPGLRYEIRCDTLTYAVLLSWALCERGFQSAEVNNVGGPCVRVGRKAADEMAKRAMRNHADAASQHVVDEPSWRVKSEVDDTPSEYGSNWYRYRYRARGGEQDPAAGGQRASQPAGAAGSISTATSESRLDNSALLVLGGLLAGLVAGRVWR